ncbi:hypothetical protein, partial [Burkholderia thailandensis]|uniref:hypothetical protein n=1 Tax=Burkholderia thailandensis TaxID=57975 RepID=UPI0021C645FE
AKRIRNPFKQRPGHQSEALFNSLLGPHRVVIFGVRIKPSLPRGVQSCLVRLHRRHFDFYLPEGVSRQNLEQLSRREKRADMRAANEEIFRRVFNGHDERLCHFSPPTAKPWRRLSWEFRRGQTPTRRQTCLTANIVIIALTKSPTIASRGHRRASLPVLRCGPDSR